MSAGKAGVLAVMDKAADREERDRFDLSEPNEMHAARMAVAELIAALAAMNALAKGPAGGVSAEKKRAVIARADAALRNAAA